MGGWVNVTPVEPTADCLQVVQTVFEEFERACSRFDERSDLSRLNRAPADWHEVPVRLRDALVAAFDAYRSTSGLFDPRVESVLRSVGYARSLADGAGPSPLRAISMGRTLGIPKSPRRALSEPWVLQVDGMRVNPGGLPIDLGGIVKGMAVDAAVDAASMHATSVLVEAGGDIRTHGRGPDAHGWRVSVENPFAATGEPVAVLDVTDAAVATSSTRIRSWVIDGQRFHHLIDPRTGQPSESDIVSVTVIDRRAAVAEVQSKTLFLQDRQLRNNAERSGIAVLWVTRDGVVNTSKAMQRHIVWAHDRASSLVLDQGSQSR